MNKETKENIGDEYLRRVKLIRESNLNSGNFIYGLTAQVQRRNYRLDKKGTSGHGPEN